MKYILRNEIHSSKQLLSELNTIYTPLLQSSVSVLCIQKANKCYTLYNIYNCMYNIMQATIIIFIVHINHIHKLPFMTRVCQQKWMPPRLPVTNTFPPTQEANHFILQLKRMANLLKLCPVQLFVFYFTSIGLLLGSEADSGKGINEEEGETDLKLCERVP